MRQNQIFSVRRWTTCFARAFVGCMVLLSSQAIASIAVAQGDFAAPNLQRGSRHYQLPAAWNQPNPAQASPASLQPPATTRMRPAVAPSPNVTPPNQFQPPAAAGWPEKAVRFDDFVQQANLETTGKDAKTEVAQAFGSTMDSASEMLGNLKSKLGGEASGWLDTNAAGSILKSDWLTSAKKMVARPDTRRMLGSLALVLGGYFAFVAVMRRFNPNGSTGIPSEVVEVMGYLPYGGTSGQAGKQNLQLVRLGSKLLLLINGPEGTHPVGEITDPGEVEYLSSMCRGSGQRQRPPKPARGAEAVQQIIRQTENRSTDTRAVTTEGLADVLRRLERVTGGSTANFEA